MRGRECESEFEIKEILSSWDRRQFITGSLESPVSTAKIYFVYSPKHASSVSKPDIEPNTENQGVQQCAGTTTAFGFAFKTIFTTSRESMPKIGRPSDAKLPIQPNCVLIFSAVSRSGAKIILCTRYTFLLI